jgi:serine protease AprX
MRLRSALTAAATLLASLSSTTALAASAPTPLAPVLQPSLTEHLAVTPATGAVRVLVQAGGLIDTATAAVKAAGLRLESTLPRVGIAVADGTPEAVLRLGSTRGVTRLDWADEPIQMKAGTSNVATRAVPVVDGAFDVDGDGVGDAFDGKGFAVAVVDSGVDGTHPMLQGSNGSRVRKNVKVLCDDVLPLLTGFSSTYDSCVVDATAVNDTDTSSAGGHGTHVAGIVAGARVTDSTGRKLRGAAPAAEVDAVSVGAGASVYGGAVGMYWVLEHHADPCGDRSCAPIVAVNNSWGPQSSSGFSPTDPSVVVGRALVAAGVTVVWAVGNSGGDGTSATTSPYSQDPTPGVIAVANYDDLGTGSRDNAVAPGSSRGLKSDPSTYPDISAPGTNITSSCRIYLPVCALGLELSDTNYTTLSGTSMAAPHIAGYVADLQEAAAKVLHRLLTPGEVEELMVDTAHHVGTTTWVTDTRNPGSTTQTSYDEGHGLVDLTAALARLTGLSLTDPGTSGCTADARFTDPSGDATGVEGVSTPAPDEPGVDVTSAWLTSSSSTHDVTFHWTVTDLPDSPGGGTEGAGEEFSFAFGFAGQTYQVQARRDEFVGQSFELQSRSGGTLATIPTGTFDPANNTITVTLPAGLIASASPGAPRITSGTVLSQLALTSYRYAFWATAADLAHGDCTYTVA